MDNLTDVGSCLRALQSPKVTERKKASTRLGELLTADPVINTLDENSQNERGIYWTIVFDAVKTYVELELEALQNAKESQSTTTLANRGRKKQEVLSLYKIVIRKSSERKPYLQSEDVLESILDWLKDDYKLKSFGSSLTNLLLKDVLRVRKYWLDISSEHWKKLLLLHCHLYINDEFDRSLLAQAIHEIVVGNMRQGALQPQKILLFFAKALEIIKSESKGTYHILSALNVFHWSIACNCRLQLCQFGEENMNFLLSIWGKSGNDKIKEELVDLLHLQMAVHHPCGVSVEQDGAMALSWTEWKRQLKNLHDSLVTDIDNTMRRTYFQGGTRGLTFLSPSYINLAAEVFNQLPGCILTSADISTDESGSQQVTDIRNSGTPAKRLRLSCEDKTLVDFVMENSNKTQAIPWLQILASLLTKFPTVFTKEDSLRVLQKMLAMLKECTRSQLFEHIFKVMSALAVCFQHGKTKESDQSRDVWQSIWTTCLNTVTSRQAQSEGYQSHGFLLMATLIEAKLVSPAKDIWNIFLLNFCKPTQASCSLLGSVITHKGLDERYCPSMLGRRNDQSSHSQFPLRQLLMEWLLSETCLTESQAADLKYPSEKIALLCLCLVHQDPRAVLQSKRAFFSPHSGLDGVSVKNYPAPSREIKSRAQVDLPTPPSLRGPNLELLFLRTTFSKDKLREHEESMSESKSTPCSSEMNSSNPVLGIVVKSLTNILERAVSSFSDLVDPNVHHLHYLVLFSTLVSRLIYYLDPDNKGNSTLPTVLRKSMEKLGFLFVSHVRVSGIPGLQPVLKSLLEMMDFGTLSDDRESNWVAKFMKSCLDVNFVDVMINLASGKVQRSASIKESILGRRNRYGSRISSYVFSQSEMNSSEDFTNNDTLNGRFESDMETDTFDTGEGSSANMGDSSQSSPLVVVNNDVSDFLSPCSLKEVDQVRLLCVKWICLVVSLDPGQTWDLQPPGLEVDTVNVQRQLIQLVSNEQFQPNKPVDLLILLVMTYQFLHQNHNMKTPDIKEFLIALRHTAKEHFKDQEICCRLLFHLQNIIPQLVSQDVSEADTVVSCRNMVVKFVKHFGMIYRKSTDRVRIEYNKVLLELIRHDPNGTWGVLVSESEDDPQGSDSACSASQLFLSHFKDNDAGVRMMIATELKWLLIKQSSNGSCEPLSKEEQLSVLRNVLRTFDEVLDRQNSQKSRNASHHQDEMESYIAVCLQGVATIINNSAVCEKECLLWVCATVTEREIPPQIVVKMLTAVCAKVRFPDVKSYLECHLPFLVFHWFERLGKILQKFPFKIMGYSSLPEFLSSHEQVIVSRLFISTSSMNDIKQFMDIIQVDLHEAILSCLPHILVSILPVYVQQAALSGPSADMSRNSTALGQGSAGILKRFKKVSKSYDVLKSELSQEEINDSVYNRLCEITILVISCLQVGGGNEQILRPDPNPPYYTQSEVEDTLDYIAKTLSGSKQRPERSSSLVSLLAKIPCGLHTVLTGLYTTISKEHRPHEILRLAQMYQLFIKMVMKEFQTGLEDNWAAVLREIMCRLFILLSVGLSNDGTNQDKDKLSSSEMGHDLQEEITLTFLDILSLVFISCLEICPDEMVNYLLRVIDLLASLASKRGAISRVAVELLEKVVIKAREQVEPLEYVLHLVNPLPDVPSLTQVKSLLVDFAESENRNLVQRLKSLTAICELPNENQSEGLALRLQSLATYVLRHQDELDNLLLLPEGLAYVSQAISQILHLSASPCLKVAKAATVLLGTIGPVELGTLSLPKVCGKTPYYLAMETYKEDVFEKYCWLLHFLDACLLDVRAEVVSVAGEILKLTLSAPHVLKFKESYQTEMRDRGFLFNYLHPFHFGHKKTNMAPPPNPAPLQRDIIQMIDQYDLWTPGSSDMTHETWITSLVCRILSSGAVTNEAFSKISPMCGLKVQINEEALPYLIHTILQGDDTNRWRECLSTHFRAFFQKHCQEIGSLATDSSPVYLKKQSVRIMLSVVQHLRKQSRRPVRGRQQAPTPWDNNFWLDLNYLHIARAAHFCRANFSALLFIEIWWDVARHDINMNVPNTLGGNTSQRSSHDHLEELSPAEGHFGNDVQALLLDIYSRVGDPDALYGCGAGKKSDPHSRVLTYLQEFDQAKALTTLDIEVSHSKTSTPLRLLQTIQACGADNLLQKCFEGFDQNYSDPMSTNSISLEEFRYETAWKLGQWDFDLPSSYDETSRLPYHKAVYHTLSSIRENHLDVASCIIEAARRTCQANFDLKAESCQGLYPFLTQLQSLGLLQEVISGLKNNDETWQTIVSGYMEGTCDDSLHYSKTTNFECVLSQLELITSLAQVLGSAGVAESTSLRLRALWGLAVCARQARRFPLAEKTVHILKLEVREVDQRTIPGITIERADMEEAKLFWARSEVKIALDVLKNLINDMNRNKGQGNWPLLPKALSTYGSWLAATRLETPTVILSNYLEKSVELLEEPCQDDKALAVECFLALAQYADAKYQHTSDYLKSPDYKDKMKLLQDVKGLLSVAEDMKESSKYLKTMERNASIDEEEIRSINQDHLQVLKQALLNYIRVLKYGTDHDVKVFRAVALWFENAEDNDVNEMIQEGIVEIASYKFLPLYYQLAARMNADGVISDFQTILSQLMERVARDHPHHTLWIIMALAHANKDDELMTKGSGRRASRVVSNQEQVTEEGRVQAAKQMLGRLKEGGDGHSLLEVIRKMEVISTSYIELANWNVNDRKNERKPFPIDQKLQITKLRDVTGILLPTVDLKVEPSGDYSKIVYPVKFDSSIRLVGGVNLPKVFICTGSDGKERTQLVKGRDDLRQDAVMQQVFSLVNQVLATDPETRKRYLSIRTYKVVPLSQKSGLLEWCQGTQPLGEYLTGTRNCEGAHVRYRPKDWKPIECRTYMHSNREKDRLKAYQEICANFKPVFRHFFMEKFKDPPQWFEKRLAYTRSVATNSIVGYVMGLGDRHVQNILVDRNTAELVHIDLGIAFEMGLVLPTPETVPFRLTRDIVDGMGVTGVEGVFRRCCEKTMQVLRNNSESLLTIVQVLVHDPLSHWSLSPHQVLAIQKKRERAGLDSCESYIQSSGSVPSSGQIRSSVQASAMDSGEKPDAKDDKNKMAERTLLRLKEKLSGVEDGSQLGVDGQVNSLIQQASDPKNLSRLFAGWQPYL